MTAIDGVALASLSPAEIDAAYHSLLRDDAAGSLL